MPAAGWEPGDRMVTAFLFNTAVAAVPDLPSAGREIFQWRPFLGPMHSVVLHFPIGFLTVTVILELCRTLWPSPELRRVTSLILWLSLLSGAVTAAFGLMRVGAGDYDPQMVSSHRQFGLAVLAFTMATLLLQTLAFRAGNLAWTSLYRLSLLATLGLVVVAGHLGGNLTHGKRYLVENAPPFLRDLIEGDAPAKSLPTAPQSRLYIEKVQPILSVKCYPCHGPEKQKGGYRLDLSDRALKGGDSGQAGIVPGDPLKSHIVQLMLLPPGHDDVMPPEGKKAPSPEELGAIIQWIREGAAFGEPSSK